MLEQDLAIKNSDYFAIYDMYWLRGETYTTQNLLFCCSREISGSLQCVIIKSQILISLVNMKPLWNIRGSNACK